jgi:hypothetical protein
MAFAPFVYTLKAGAIITVISYTDIITVSAKRFLRLIIFCWRVNR